MEQNGIIFKGVIKCQKTIKKNHIRKTLEIQLFGNLFLDQEFQELEDRECMLY